MDNLWFQKITITQIQYINVQQILVVTFEFRPTGAARGFMIMSSAARGVKKVGQHCCRRNWTAPVQLSAVQMGNNSRQRVPQARRPYAVYWTCEHEVSPNHLRVERLSSRAGRSQDGRQSGLKAGESWVLQVEQTEAHNARLRESSPIFFI